MRWPRSSSASSSRSAAWQFWLYAAKMARAHETTFVLQIPIAPFWFGVDAICGAPSLSQLIVTLRHMRAVRAMTPSPSGRGPRRIVVLILAQVPIGFAMIVVGVPASAAIELGRR